MSRTLTTPTRTGLCALIARKFELMSVIVTLRTAERDREFLEREALAAPDRLRCKDLDIQALRVRRANLQS